MNVPACTFDEATHTYAINGRPVPHVTAVLSDLLPGFRASDWYLQRGRAIHACAAMVGRGIAFEHDPRIAGQVEAVRRFYREVQPEVVEVEWPVYSERFQYAGTVDLIAVLKKFPLIVDYKASLTPSTVFQCAAYALAYPHPINHGVGIELHEDGTYKMSEIWDLKRAKQEWLALLGAHNIRARLGYTHGGDDVHD